MYFCDIIKIKNYCLSCTISQITCILPVEVTCNGHYFLLALGLTIGTHPVTHRSPAHDSATCKTQECNCFLGDKFVTRRIIIFRNCPIVIRLKRKFDNDHFIHLLMNGSKLIVMLIKWVLVL